MIREITVQELKTKLDSRSPLVLLDVRQPEEHAYAALPGSVLIPLDELSRRWSEVQADAAITIVAYCHHGIRSLHAAGFLTQRGIQNVVSLAGGIDAWSRQIDPTIPRY